MHIPHEERKAMPRPSIAVKLGTRDRRQLEAISRSQRMPAGVVRRARIVLRLAEGESVGEVAERYGVSRPTVSLWHRRFAERGVPGLQDASKPGRPRTADDAAISRLLDIALHRTPAGGTRWSRRALAAETGLSKSTVHRYLTLFGLESKPTGSPKSARDPLCVAAVRHIAGVYLAPPACALALAADRRRGIRIPRSGRPRVPAQSGVGAGVPCGCGRCSISPLFAALDAANGPAATHDKPHRRQGGFLAFLRRIEANVPAHLGVHIVCVDQGSHAQPRVLDWLACRPRFHLHVTRGYHLWLSEIECWIGALAQVDSRADASDPSAGLTRKVNDFVERYQRYREPLTWTPADIAALAQSGRTREEINGTTHSKVAAFSLRRK